MKLILLLIIMFISFKTIAGDEGFKYITPVDAFITKYLKWDDTERAGKYSDNALNLMAVAPYIYALAEKERRWKRVSTVAVVQIFNVTLTDTIKVWAQRTRPNGKNARSFPSGHTSAAFVSAGLICGMHKKSCPAAIVAASSVGYFRLAANWHYFSDIVVGAGIGFMNGKYIPKLVIEF